MVPRRPELHVITSGIQTLDEVLAMANNACAGGMDYLHIREKHRTARECMDWVIALSEVIPRDRLIVNDRVDVAAAAGCRGAHLAYHSLSPKEARRVLASGQWIGRSVHSIAEASEAAADGVDYVLYGHIFPSNSKPGLSPRGTEELSNITAQLPVPVIGIGGITPQNCASVLAAGCVGVAVLSGITGAANVKSAASAYRRALDEWEENKG